MGLRTDPVTPNLPTPGVAFSQKAGLHQESATALHPVGTRLKLDDGRTFYYCKCGGTGVVKVGQVIAAKQIIASEKDTNLSAAEVISSREISVTAVAATGVSYEGGYLTVVGGTGIGQTHKIRNCTTTAAAGTALVTLYDGLAVALDTSSDTILIPNPFWGVGTELTNGQQVQVLGTNMIPMTANYYSWLQTYGWASMYRGDSTGTEQEERSCFSHASGQSVLTTSGGVVGAQKIGYHVYDSADGVSTEWDLVFLTCVA